MTVSSATNRIKYSGNGLTTAFAFNNLVLDADDLVVTLISSAGVETVQTRTTHYTVSGTGTNAVTVTMVTPPASGESLLIVRSMAYLQSVDFTENEALPAETLETALDRAAIRDQQLNDAISRSLVIPTSDAAGLDMTLPTVANRASKVLAFTAAGLPTAVTFASIAVSIDTALSSEADGDFLVYDGTNWVNEPPATARASLGVEAAVQDFVDVASATTTDIGAASSRNVRVTGTTTITGLGTVAAGTSRYVRFAAALTLTHNGTSLILPGGANITTAADDTATFISLGSGNWLCTGYKRAGVILFDIIDEDSMATDSAVKVPSQQSVKAYVDARIGATGLAPTARAYITNGGSAALAEEVGVASINRTGTGVIAVTLDDTMASSTYVVLSMAVNNDGFQNITAQSTTGFTIRTDNSGGAATDYDFMFVVIGTKA